MTPRPCNEIGASVNITSYAIGTGDGTLFGATVVPGGGRNNGRYVTTRAKRDIPMENIAGWLAAARVSSLSPNQPCTDTITDTQPIIRFRMNMAAIGMLLDNVLLKSPPSFAAGGVW